jgi:hypothetical protein
MRIVRALMGVVAAWLFLTPGSPTVAAPLEVICPRDTVLRPGRAALLDHGCTNTTDGTVIVCYAIRGERWPAPTLISDRNPIFAGSTQTFRILVEVPDSATAGTNVVTWGAACPGIFTCTYRIEVPELVSSAAAEADARAARITWTIADSSADTATVHRRHFGGWEAIGPAFAEGDVIRFVDDSVTPGETYEYRLALPVENRSLFRGKTSVRIPELLDWSPRVSFIDETLRMEWVPSDTFAFHATVQRSFPTEDWRHEPDWETRAELATSGGAPLIYEERELEPGRLYHYRLRIAWNGGWLTSHLIGVPAPLRPDELRLACLSGNPARGPLRFAVTMGSPQDARLDLLDALGRLVESRSWAGRHGRFEVEAAPAGALRPGVYFARLVQGTRERRLRLVVLNSR